jgi:hypothetical protein
MLGSIAPRLKWLEKDATIAPRISGIRKFLYAQTQTCLMGAMDGLRALSAAQIPFMLLKGAARIARNPAASQERLIRDLDILVRPETQEKAIAVLRESGWAFAETGEWQARWYHVDGFASHHAWAFAKGTAEIDVHHFSNYLNRLMGDDDALWQRAETLHWRGLRALVPSTTDNLLLSLIHGVRWSADENADWTIDASGFIDSGVVDWSVFVKEAKTRMVEAVCAAGLRYLNNALKKRIPPEVLIDLDATTTPQHLAEFRWYASSPMPRNAAEAASALEMAKLRLPPRHIPPRSGYQRIVSVEAGKRKLVTVKLPIGSTEEFVSTLVVKFKTSLPEGTALVAGIRIMGFVLDVSRGVVVVDKSGGGLCEFVFNAPMPLLRLRGVSNVLFVAGLDEEVGPLEN